MANFMQEFVFLSELQYFKKLKLILKIVCASQVFSNPVTSDPLDSHTLFIFMLFANNV